MQYGRITLLCVLVFVICASGMHDMYHHIKPKESESTMLIFTAVALYEIVYAVLQQVPRLRVQAAGIYGFISASFPVLSFCAIVPVGLFTDKYQLGDVAFMLLGIAGNMASIAHNYRVSSEARNNTAVFMMLLGLGMIGICMLLFALTDFNPGFG
jgi:hypothetical protein